MSVLRVPYAQFHSSALQPMHLTQSGSEMVEINACSESREQAYQAGVVFCRTFWFRERGRQRQRMLLINILEFQLSLLHCSVCLQNLPFLRVQSDNATVLAYLNHQGGTRSYSTQKEAQKTGRWIFCRQHLYREGGYTFLLELFHKDFICCGECQFVYLLKSKFNHKQDEFVFGTKDPLTFAVHALVISWDQFSLICTFHPLQLLPQSVTHDKYRGHS